MKDISLHLLDIFENSAKAGASLVELNLSWYNQCLEVSIADNGPGFPDSIKSDPTNPFNTTRTTRDVGLGLNLIQEAAEQTGGEMILDESEYGGVLINVTFFLDHIDAKPIGSLEDTIMTALTAWPDINFKINLGKEGESIFDTELVKEEIGISDINHPDILKYLREVLEEEFAKIYRWASAIEPNLIRNPI